MANELEKKDIPVSLNGINFSIRLCNRGSVWWWGIQEFNDHGKQCRLRLSGATFRSEDRAMRTAMEMIAGWSATR